MYVFSLYKAENYMVGFHLKHMRHVCSCIFGRHRVIIVFSGKLLKGDLVIWKIWLSTFSLIKTYIGPKYISVLIWTQNMIVLFWWLPSTAFFENKSSLRWNKIIYTNYESNKCCFSYAFTYNRIMLCLWKWKILYSFVMVFLCINWRITYFKLKKLGFD